MNISEHRKRLFEIGKHQVPPEGSKARSEWENIHATRMKDPHFKKEIKKIWKKAQAIVIAQQENGSALPMSEHLRFFLGEFNGRNFEHGLNSMPASFNIMEAFYEYDPSLSVFKIHEEREHLISFVDFLDYVTSSEALGDFKASLSFLENNMIYSFDLLSNS